jgi:hypothetical protein
VQAHDALCRFDRSQNKPFCDGRHPKILFNGTESAGSEPYLQHPRVIRGPDYFDVTLQPDVQFSQKVKPDYMAAA